MKRKILIFRQTLFILQTKGKDFLQINDFNLLNILYLRIFGDIL